MTIHYFGYGAMENPAIIEALLGRLPKGDTRGKMSGYFLAIQNLEHLPNIPRLHDDVEINPQALMRQEWGDNFRSYTIVPNPNGRVCGTVWHDLTAQERELLR